MTPIPDDYLPWDVTTWSPEQLADDLGYQTAPGLHTLTACECGRQGRRSGGPCAACLRDELARRRRSASPVDALPADWAADAKGREA